MLTRRSAVKLGLTAAGSLACAGGVLAEGEPTLPAWSPGVLELHHIDTGRGNATFVLAPDGTTMLIDAGEAHGTPGLMSAPRPDAATPAGVAVVNYIQKQLRRAGRDALDVVLMTHLHGDHVGEATASTPAVPGESFRLTGAGYVARDLAIGTWLDRGWPDYREPSAPSDRSAANYIAMVRSLAARGKTELQRAVAGSSTQFGLRRSPEAFSNFSARVLSVNGNLWTGESDGKQSLFPALAHLPGGDQPDENMCSIALLLRYGRFSYYTGGDLPCDTRFGRLPWHDVETPVAMRAGPVSVAVANHHGYFDSCGPGMVRALRPRVWILPTWHVTHPALSVMNTLTSRELYPDERSIYALELAPASRLLNDRFAASFSSTSGHVIVRVEPGGGSFRVFVVSAESGPARVLREDGPFRD